MTVRIQPICSCQINFNPDLKIVNFFLKKLVECGIHSLDQFRWGERWVSQALNSDFLVLHVYEQCPFNTTGIPFYVMFHLILDQLEILQLKTRPRWPLPIFLGNVQGASIPTGSGCEYACLRQTISEIVHRHKHKRLSTPQQWQPRTWCDILFLGQAAFMCCPTADWGKGTKWVRMGGAATILPLAAVILSVCKSSETAPSPTKKRAGERIHHPFFIRYFQQGLKCQLGSGTVYLPIEPS